MPQRLKVLGVWNWCKGNYIPAKFLTKACKLGLRDGSAVKIQVSQSYGMNFVSKQNNSNNNKEGVGAITKQRKRSQEEGKVLAIQAVGLEFSSPEPRKRA